MTPATVEDAYTMLIEAVAIDDPVVYCEHKYLYYHLKADKLPDKGLPTGRARIAREGRDLTIVSYSAMTQESLAAAEELAREGLEVEVVDLRTVKPLDTDTVLASVARTGRLLCVGESFPWGGTTAEVIARVTSQGFHLLDAAPRRLNAKDTPIPYHPNLWSAHRPNAKNIAAKARALLTRIEFYAASPDHHAATWRINRRSHNRRYQGQTWRRSCGRSGNHRRRDEQSGHGRDHAVQRQDR